jgi:hypothetical protein
MSHRHWFVSPPTTAAHRSTAERRKEPPVPGPRASEGRATVRRAQRDLVIASLLRCPDADGRVPG